jgi:hypothetical protein
MGIDLATGVVTNFSKAPGTYNDVEVEMGRKLGLTQCR